MNLNAQGTVNEIEYKYGNPVDLFALKANVQRDYRGQVVFWREKARRLYGEAGPRQACVLCGATEYEVVGHTYDWPWHQCKACTHVYNGRQLPPEKYLEFYQTVNDPINYSDTYTDSQVQDHRREFVSRPKVDYISSFCPIKGKWLDVAAGNGDVAYLARQKGFDSSGVEINAASVRFAREHYGLDLYLGKIEDFEKEVPGKWEVMSFLGISDIIVNPVEYIQVAYRLLTPNGILAMSFPNFNSLSTAIQLTYHEQIVCRHLYPSVISMYTEKSATLALQREGFTVLAIWYFGMDTYELLNNLAFAEDRFRGSKAYMLLRQMLKQLQLVFDSAKSSDEFLVIAAKN